jgi:hypothetical protein
VVIVIGEKIEKLKLYVEYVKHIFAKSIAEKQYVLIVKIQMRKIQNNIKTLLYSNIFFQ